MILFKLISKFVDDILVIAIIVVAVLVFAYFDPFGIFNPKLKLTGTALMVKEVKEIGQLYSAEYYGEVIESRDNSLLANEEEIKEAIKDLYNALTEEFNAGRVDCSDKLWSKHAKTIYERYKDEPYFDLLSSQFRKRQQPNNFLTRDLAARRFLKIICEERTEDLTDEDLDKVYTFYIKNYRHNSKREKKREIVCVARGSVKAGLDLSQIEENDIYFDEVNGIVRIRNAKVTVFDTIMNPWFIHQNGVEVPGFDFFRLEGKLHPEHVQQIKISAKKQLVEQAYNRDIMKHARRNAKGVLKRLFSLLLEAEVNEVQLVSGPVEEMAFLAHGRTAFTTQQAFTLYKIGLFARFGSNQSRDGKGVQKQIYQLKQKELFLPNYRNELFNGTNTYCDTCFKVPFNLQNLQMFDLAQQLGGMDSLSKHSANAVAVMEKYDEKYWAPTNPTAYNKARLKQLYCKIANLQLVMDSLTADGFTVDEADTIINRLTRSYHHFLNILSQIEKEEVNIPPSTTNTNNQSDNEVAELAQYDHESYTAQWLAGLYRGYFDQMLQHSLLITKKSTGGGSTKTDTLYQPFNLLNADCLDELQIEDNIDALNQILGKRFSDFYTQLNENNHATHQE